MVPAPPIYRAPWNQENILYFRRIRGRNIRLQLQCEQYCRSVTGASFVALQFFQVHGNF